MRLSILVFVALPVFACGKAAAPPADTKCRSDDDCVLHCQRRGDCCSNPYCDSAMHRLVADDARKFNQDNCKKDDFAKCPQIGSREPRDFAMVPKCRAQACVAEKVSTKDAASSLPQ